jgi:hypothetical protein
MARAISFAGEDWPAVITYTSCSRTCLSRWTPTYWKSRSYSWESRDTIS